MKRIAPWLVAATLALAAPLSQAVTLRVANQGDVAVDGPALAQREPAAELHRQRLRVADRARQEHEPRAGAGDEVDAAEPDGLAIRPAPGREIPRRHAVHGRRRGVHVQARGRRRLGHEGLHESDQGGAQGRRSRRRDRDHRAVSDPARYADDAGDDEQEVVRGQQGRAPGRPPQGDREHGQLQGERHRPVPAQGAPAVGAHRAGQELQLVGQVGRQRRRDRVHADRQRRHPRRGAPFRRDRCHGAGAAAGRRAHQVGRHQRAAGPGAAHDLPRHGPEARRAAVQQRQGQEPVQGRSRPPRLLSGDRRRDDQGARHARRGAAHRPDGRLGGARLSGRHEQAAVRTTPKRRRSCSPMPATRTASRSA